MDIPHSACKICLNTWKNCVNEIQHNYVKVGGHDVHYGKELKLQARLWNAFHFTIHILYIRKAILSFFYFILKKNPYSNYVGLHVFLRWLNQWCIYFKPIGLKLQYYEQPIQLLLATTLALISQLLKLCV